MKAGSGTLSLKSEVDEARRPIVERLLQQWRDPEWKEAYKGIRCAVGEFCDRVAEMHDGSPVYEGGPNPIKNAYQRKRILSGRCERTLFSCEEIAGPSLSESDSRSLREAAISIVRENGGRIKGSVPSSGKKLARYATKTEQEFDQIIDFLEWAHGELPLRSGQYDEKGLVSLMKALCSLYVEAVGAVEGGGILEEDKGAVEVCGGISHFGRSVPPEEESAIIRRRARKILASKNGNLPSGETAVGRGEKEVALGDSSIGQQEDCQSSGAKEKVQDSGLSIVNLYDGLVMPSHRAGLAGMGFIRESMKCGSVLGFRADEDTLIRAVVVGESESVPGMRDWTKVNSPVAIICDGHYIFGITTVPTIARLHRLEWWDVLCGGSVSFEVADRLLGLAISEGEKFFVRNLRRQGISPFSFSDNMGTRLGEKRTNRLTRLIGESGIFLPSHSDTHITGDLVLGDERKNDIETGKLKGAWRPIRQEGSGRVGFTFCRRVVGKKKSLEGVLVCVIEPSACGGMEIVCGTKTRVLRDGKCRLHARRPLYTPSSEPEEKRAGVSWWGRIFINEALKADGVDEGPRRRIILTEGPLLDEARAIHSHLLSLKYDSLLVDVVSEGKAELARRSAKKPEVKKPEVKQPEAKQFGQSQGGETMREEKDGAGGDVVVKEEQPSIDNGGLSIEERVARLEEKNEKKRKPGRPKGSRDKAPRKKPTRSKKDDRESESETESKKPEKDSESKSEAESKKPERDSTSEPDVGAGRKPESATGGAIPLDELDGAISALKWAMGSGAIGAEGTVILGGMVLSKNLGQEYVPEGKLSVDTTKRIRGSVDVVVGNIGILLKNNIVDKDGALAVVGRVSSPPPKRRGLSRFFR